MRLPFVPRSTHDMLDRLFTIQTEALFAERAEVRRLTDVLTTLKRDGFTATADAITPALPPLPPLPPIVASAVGSIPMSESERVQIETQCRAWLDENISAEEVRRRIYDGEAA